MRGLRQAHEVKGKRPAFKKKWLIMASQQRCREMLMALSLETRPCHDDDRKPCREDDNICPLVLATHSAET